jgi:hypothetical protein
VGWKRGATGRERRGQRETARGNERRGYDDEGRDDDGTVGRGGDNEENQKKKKAQGTSTFLGLYVSSFLISLFVTNNIFIGRRDTDAVTGQRWVTDAGC